jgi:triphosphoribosyl-dephospho-CoA synthase
MASALSLATCREPGASPADIAQCAVDALTDEAMLTPKPALVDARGSGAHRDLDLDTMLRSSRAQPRAPRRRKPCANDSRASAAKAKSR